MPVTKRGVNSIAKAGSAQIKGDVTLTGGTNVTLTQSGQDISIASAGGAGGGTVTSVSVTTANGVSGSVATDTTTPAISLTLGAITPTSLGSATVATTQTPADNSTKLATTGYVDNAILGQRYKEACKYASTAALPTVVYDNGSSGVGATLTGVALAALSMDGASPAVADRVLIKNQVASEHNGTYTVTATGSGIAVFVLTRGTDFNQASDIQTGDSAFVTAGTVNISTTWAYTGIDSPTMGTTALTFVQAAGPGVNTAGNGITITGASIAIDATITADLTTAQTFTNKTLTSPKINEAVALTSSATELNVLDGIPATLTATELGYVDGVTSAIQTQLNAKAASLGADDNYVTDAQLVVIGNTSNTNTGDNTLAATVASANEATDTSCFILFQTASGTTSLATKNNTGLTYNSNTNAVGATTFVGALTGTASGNITSSVTTLSSLVSIGTITTGTWTGTDIAVADGGTGRSTGTTAYSLVATGTTATAAQQTLANGATTEVLVGGGAAALPAWTTATGSGAPVRATSPTLVTPLLGTPTSGVATNITALNATQLTTGTIPDARMPNLTGDVTTVEGAVATTIGTSVVGNTQLVAGVGVQVVNTTTGAVATGTTIIPWDDTVPQNTEGDQYMSCAITPKSTTNILVIQTIVNLASSVNNNLSLAIFQDATAGALAAICSSSSVTNTAYILTLTHTMVAGTTSATTFKVRAGGSQAGTTTLNGSAGTRKFGGVASTSSIVIWEYKAS